MNNEDCLSVGQSTDNADVVLSLATLIDTRMLIQGNSGAGKSRFLRLLAEQAASKVPTVIIDPEGEFSTLRELHKDLLLVGRDGEVATDVKTAGLLARKLCELNVSAVLDIYDLKVSDRRKFVRLFLESLLSLPKTLWHPMLLMIDETHQFCPERASGEAESTEAIITLMAQGRKRGFGSVLATQRLSKLHKDAAAETNNILIGRTWLDVDQKRAGDLLGMSGGNRVTLRDLAPGTFNCFGPAFVGRAGVFAFTAANVKTTHPKPGSRHTLHVPKGSTNLYELVRQLGDLPKESSEEAHTLEALRQRVRELESSKGKISEVEVKEALLEAQEAKEKVYRLSLVLHGAAKAVDGILREGDHVSESLAKVRSSFQDLHYELDQAVSKPERVGKSKSIKSIAFLSSGQARLDDNVPTISFDLSKLPLPQKRIPRAMEGDNSDKFTDPQFRILRSFFWLRNEKVTPVKAAFFANYTDNGHFRNALGGLRSLGLVEGWEITEAGIAKLSEYNVEDKPSGPALREWMRPKLSEPQNKILTQLVAVRGNAVPTKKLASLSGYTDNGHFRNCLGKLRSLEMAIGGERDGGVRCNPIFL